MGDSALDSDDEGEVPPLLGMEALTLQQQQRQLQLPPTKVPQAPPPCAVPEAAEQPFPATPANGIGSIPAAAGAPPSSGAEGGLTGQRVQIHGLTARPELNGRTAEAGRWLPDKQRYDMRVGGATLAIRPANLRPVSADAQPTAGESAAGIKKGFLGGSCSCGGTSEGSGAPSSIPLVRGDGEGGKSSLKLPEVQASMAQGEAAAAAASAGGKDGWVTPELLSKIAADPLLRKAFTDPRYTDAMSALQTDPKAAMAKYGHIDEMRTFMQSFMKLMGNHFTALVEKQQASEQAATIVSQPLIAPAETEEEKRARQAAEKAMADPQVRLVC
mmetsp:Transcript_35989/g.114668  ORF Transcript_35989/g.114668 Transcript_35989/m.114668 type:complete len:329 (+) Transcript_35989:377-1363(+)